MLQKLMFVVVQIAKGSKGELEAVEFPEDEEEAEGEGEDEEEDEEEEEDEGKEEL